MSDIQQLLSENLKFYRKQKNLKQSDVAEASGILTSTYSRIETGQVSPNLSSLERICEAMGIRIVELFQSREISDKSLAQKLEAIQGLSEYNRNVVEILLDSIIEKDALEKSQEVKMRKRLEELGKVRSSK
jgi:transcriptional regulator with XRE-family HTH domain